MSEDEARTCSDQVTALVDYLAAHEIIADDDRIWAFNTLMAALGEAGTSGPASAPADSPKQMPQPALHPATDPGTARAADASAGIAGRLPQIDSSDPAFDLFRVLQGLVATAKRNGAAPVTGDGDDGIASWLMGLVMPRPSEVARRFEELRREDSRCATTWFSRFCGDVGYVKRGAIARNIRWKTPTRWDTLDITINLSKPEKDPRAIARAATATQGASGETPYPACALCLSNEGYAGRPADDPAGPHAARQDLRIVPIELGGERWGLQYSPYAYFPEHCIAIAPEHRPMRIDRACLERLLDFVDLFPHYFIGSNADLPIVGGSILSHDHFQGGRYLMPMESAEEDERFEIPEFPQVEAMTLVWPLSVVRLRSTDREKLATCAEHVLAVWRSYDDATVGIVSHDAAGKHNTVTPICRRRADVYEMDLVLRCNVTNDAHPLGRFHPGEELWHLKRENIGLIEVMGLAILPPRLQREFAAVGEEMLGEHDFEGNPLACPHAAWAREILERRGDEIAPDTVEDVIKQEAGEEFARVLEACGVFKWDAPGRAAQERFLDSL